MYRREVGRLLAEGHEGKWVLIKDDHVHGIWHTEEEVNQVRVQHFPMQDVMIKQILEREPMVRCTRLFHPGFLNAGPTRLFTLEF